MIVLYNIIPPCCKIYRIKRIILKETYHPNQKRRRPDLQAAHLPACLPALGGRLKKGMMTMINHLNDKTKLEQKLTAACKKPLAQCSCHEIYAGLLSLVQDLAGERRSPAGKKKLYYISAEFLIGKLLSNKIGRAHV